MLALAAPAAAQDYPARPIRVIASQGAGGFREVGYTKERVEAREVSRQRDFIQT
jgi:hypothetical protein